MEKSYRDQFFKTHLQTETDRQTDQQTGPKEAKETTKIKPGENKLPTESYDSGDGFVIPLILREPDSPSFPIPFILSSEKRSSDRTAPP